MPLTWSKRTWCSICCCRSCCCCWSWTCCWESCLCRAVICWRWDCNSTWERKYSPEITKWFLHDHHIYLIFCAFATFCENDWKCDLSKLTVNLRKTTGPIQGKIVNINDWSQNFTFLSSFHIPCVFFVHFLFPVSIGTMFMEGFTLLFLSSRYAFYTCYLCMMKVDCFLLIQIKRYFPISILSIYVLLFRNKTICESDAGWQCDPWPLILSLGYNSNLSLHMITQFSSIFQTGDMIF